MPIEEALMDTGSWSVRLDNVPRAARDLVDLESAAHSTVFFTRQHHDPTAVSTNWLFSQAVFSGVYLDQDDDGHTIAGDGLPFWLGSDSDDGDLYTGADSTSASGDLSTRLSANVITFANGLTAGTVDSTTGTITLTFKGGQSRRETLDTLVAAYGYEWKISPAGAVSVAPQATLFTSNSVLLTDQGGRGSGVTGLRAELAADRKSVRDWRKTIEVDWNSGTANGTATNAVPSGWVNFAGGTIARTSYMTSQPRGRIRGRRTVARIAAWIFNNQTRASVAAAREAAAVNTYEYTITAQIYEQPWRWMTVGDTVYVHDQAQRVIDNSYEVPFRGETIHPKRLRVVSWEAPVTAEMGVYMLVWNTGTSAFDVVDLTPYVVPEETTTSLELSTTARYHRRRPHQRRLTRRQARRIARHIHQMDLIADYVRAVS